MTDEFGYWFSGLVDGEATFTIRQHTRHPNYECSFAISLRDDDFDVLDVVHQTTGIGKLFSVKGYRTTNPQTRWLVRKKSDCLQLVDILDRYPLRTKKQNDFRIWREAVLLWSTLQRGTPFDWSEFAPFFDALKEARTYSPNQS